MHQREIKEPAGAKISAAVCPTLDHSVRFDSGRGRGGGAEIFFLNKVFKARCLLSMLFVSDHRERNYVKIFWVPAVAVAFKGPALVITSFKHFVSTILLALKLISPAIMQNSQMVVAVSASQLCSCT